MSKEEQEINLPLHGKIKRSRSVTEKKDKLEERLRVSNRFVLFSHLHLFQKQLKENPDALFNAVYPILKIKAAENLLNEVQNINLNKEYESNREKTFQILRALLNDPEFCDLLVNEATKKINEPTGNWMQHPPLDVYLERMQKENPKVRIFSRINSIYKISGLQSLRWNIVDAAFTFSPKSSSARPASRP